MTQPHPYIESVIRTLDGYRVGLWEELHTVPELPGDQAEEVLQYFVSLACEAQNELNIRLGRECLWSLPRAWVIEHLRRVAEDALDLSDEWEQARLEEVRSGLGLASGGETDEPPPVWEPGGEATGPPLTDELLVEAEAVLKSRLPLDYVDALRKQNGGAPAGDYVAIPEQRVPEELRGHVERGFVGVGDIFGIGPPEWSILRTSYWTAEWSLPEGLILIGGDGHTWVAFDTRLALRYPPVILIESESGSSLRLANTFAEFCRSLARHEDLFDDNGEWIKSGRDE